MAANEYVNSAVNKWARAKDAAIGAVDSIPAAHEKVATAFMSPPNCFPGDKGPMLDSLVFTCPSRQDQKR